MNNTNQNMNLDAVVVGAGFSGLYMLYRLREAGFSIRAFEAAADVGGVWYANRYPGARCDSESIIYNYTFSQELLQEWTWTSRYPEQTEILSYLNYVADKFDLRRDIQFNTRITAAHYDEVNNRWRIQMDDGTRLSAKYFITGVGCLSASNVPNFKGLDRFEGEWYHTGRWPHEKVDLKGKRVGVIGTGSSGIQSIPVIAEEAEHLTVFQRTPAYSTPARNYRYDPEFIRETKANYNAIKQQIRWSKMGYLHKVINDRSALDDTPEERLQEYEKVWKKGGLGFSQTYQDLMVDGTANETAGEFIRSKIDEIVKEPKVAEKLKPTYYYAAKRPVLDTNYYETYNRENVSLVDVKAAPIVEITSKGLRTSEAEYKLDVIVFATGYDAMTGPLFKIDIRGKGGIALKDKWADGTQTRTYLGIANAGFPNMFMITGPQSPSVLSNMPVSIEQHVEWIGDCIEFLRDHEVETIEADVEAEDAWSNHCSELADATLMTKVDSWYTGANIEGKARGLLIYVGGVGEYRKICNEVADKGYEGFSLIYSTSKETVS
ncbi:NAD(P)/FAD-dependent oxidoreductase [Neobacillus niacini]|uniref:flavin-containing monooxygenase n=1 Tax=Neobacillus niacini TaxID=86668 RepID=UPI00285B9455|nr:NAD(P)/FAD-dependent oxidoreductase [Neobacillus niacini]MDR6998415.1 cation diffusion facilitator CzcD-associated flavoprotein CzcO [Neobacillus niacini]